MPKIPTWLKIVVPLLFLMVLFVFAAASMWFAEVPEEAREEAIQARFAGQISVLEELAQTVPDGVCDGLETLSLESAREMVSTLKAWEARFATQEALFADPSILGAKVLQTCNGSEMSYVLKDYKRSLSFSRAMVMPPTTWPAVSLWFIGGERAVKYEDRIDAEAGETKGFVLTLDLEPL